MSTDQESGFQAAIDDVTRHNEPVSEPSNVDDESPTSQPRGDDGRFTTEHSEDAPADGESELETASDESQEAAAADDEAGDSDEPSTDEQPEQPRKQNRRTLLERNAQLTAQKNEALAKAAAAEQRLAEIQERWNGQQPDPDLEFSDPAAFAQQALERTLDAREAQAADREARAAKEAAFASDISRFNAQLDMVRERNELPADFEQIVYSDDVPIPADAVPIIADSEEGWRVAYYLAKNKGEARRIASLPPVQLGAELARIEARVSARPAQKTTKAPQPAKAISTGGGSGRFDPATAGPAGIQKLIYPKR